LQLAEFTNSFMIPSENNSDQVASLPGWNPFAIPSEINPDQPASQTASYRGFVSVLLMCVAGAFLGGFTVHMLHPIFAYEQLPNLELGSPPALVKRHHDAALAYRTRNYAAEFAIIGLALGVSIGACSRGSRFLLCAIGGGFVGALSGAGLGFVAGSYITKTLLVNAEQTLQSSMGLQTLVWGGVLANITWLVAALNLGVIRALKYWPLGLLAGFVVAVLQFVISSLLFPNSNPMFLVPEETSERAYWLAAYPLAAGLVMAVGLYKLRPQRS
jgi:hypothetical protein